MTTTPRLFRNCALALPLVVLTAGVLGGTLAAAEVAVAGSLAVLNLAALAWMGSGFVQEAAYGGSGAYGSLLVAKTAVTIPLFGLLLTYVEPLNAVAGLCSPVLAVGLTGFELALVGEGEVPLSQTGAGLPEPSAEPLES